MKIEKLEYVDEALPPDQYADTWNRIYLFTLCRMKPSRILWPALYRVRHFRVSVLTAGQSEPVAYLYTRLPVN